MRLVRWLGHDKRRRACAWWLFARSRVLLHWHLYRLRFPVPVPDLPMVLRRG